jgi:propanediol utilization protein
MTDIAHGGRRMQPAAPVRQRAEVEGLVRSVLRERISSRRSRSPASPPHPLVVNVSARHVHCTQNDLEVLFGTGAGLSVYKPLYQQGEFASNQLVTIVGPRQRIIPNVRILGPLRSYTQVELSYTDGVYLGIELPLRISGEHKDTPGVTLIGPAGTLSLGQGVIRARRHVHMSNDDMNYFNVRDGDTMKLRVSGPCGLVFDNLVVRHHPKVVLEVHIDTDEGNACDIESATHLELVK